MFFLDEQKLNAAIDDIRSLEKERREAAVDAEKARYAELETSVEQLKLVTLL